MANLTTIQTTDVLMDSRAVINANFDALNSALAACIPAPDTTSTGGYFLRRNAANTGWELVALSNAAIVYSDTIPTTSGTINDIVRISTPVAGGNLGWICLGGTTWKPYGVIGL
jgi:hypothetical protein